MGTTPEELPQVQYRDREGPTLRKLLASGERRRDFLNEMIDQERGSPGALQFARAERLFVAAGIEALALNHAMLRDETSPVVALRDIVAELEELKLFAPGAAHPQLARIARRAQRILQELGSR